MVILKSYYSRNHRSYRITDVRYGGRPPDPDFPKVESGCFLPSSKPFPLDTNPPLASFKTYTAMCNAGLKTMADQLLANNHRSWITTDYIKLGMLNFAGKVPPRITDPVYYELLNELRDQFDVDSKLYPLTLDRAASEIPQSTSPGLPYIITHKGMKKSDIFAIQGKNINRYWSRVGKGQRVVPLDDTAAFARSHISKLDTNKVRAVWCTPLSVIVQEARFALPITRGLINQSYGFNTCYGMETMKGGMCWLDEQLKRAKLIDPGLSCVMTDYTSFDSSVPAWMIRDVFNIFLEKFDLRYEIGPDGKLSETNVDEEKRKWKKLVDYFIQTPIRLNNGERFLKTHGVPSGSVFTNLIDTAVNFLVSRFIQIKVYGVRSIFDLYFGDDGLFVMPSSAVVDIDKTVEVAKEFFGLNLSKTKSYRTTNMRNVKLLGYYNNFGSPVKPTKELLLSMLYPQRLKDDWAYCVSRALGCLLASGGANSTVFQVAQAVFLHALDSGAVDRGLEIMFENPRARRHLDQMGCGDLQVSYRFFFDQSLSIPVENCTKIQRGINLV